MSRLLNLPPALAVPDSSPLSARAHQEPAHPYRTNFVRDSARILHSRAFRRLAGKTQVFSRNLGAETSDHLRSRLTHTLEVAQIARSIAAVLGLNPNLTEALALVHDIGHPPYGHAGEKALDSALRAHGLTFDHNLHALRIVTHFEERHPAYRGLNLTLAVREGIIKHSRDYSPERHPDLEEYFLSQFPPLEAQLIDLADEIAYLTADLDDGFDSGLLSLDSVRASVPLFRSLHDSVLAAYPAAVPRLIRTEALKRLLNAFVTDLMESLAHQVRELRIETIDDLRHAPRRLVAFSPPIEAERASLKKYLYQNLYLSPDMEQVHDHATHIVTSLFNSIFQNPALLPADHQAEIPSEGLARTVADYIAGMTDNFIEHAWRTVKKN